MCGNYTSSYTYIVKFVLYQYSRVFEEICFVLQFAQEIYNSLLRPQVNELMSTLKNLFSYKIKLDLKWITFVLKAQDKIINC